MPQFPVLLRKMWSGGEVQEWIEQNIPDQSALIAQLESEKAELVAVLKRMDEWLKVRHLGGLMPDEKAIIEKYEVK
jgi:hypothetical protein